MLKMEKTGVISLFFFMGLLASCGSQERKMQESILPVIDLEAEYPTKEITLQDVADIQYIPLETNDNVLLSNKVKVSSISDKGIMVTGDDRIWLFDSNGKALRCIDNKGNAPGNYNRIDEVDVDWQSGYIFIKELQIPKIHVYTLEGKAVRDITFSQEEWENGWLGEINHYNSDYLLAARNFIGEGSPSDLDLPACAPYLFIDKESGRQDTLNGYIQRLKANTHLLIGGSLMILGDYTRRTIVKCGNDFYLSHLSSDTVFALKEEGRFEPILVRTPSYTTKEGQKQYLLLESVTDPYLFVSKLKSAYELVDGTAYTNSNPHMIYDRRTGETFLYQFNNNDFATQKIGEFDFVRAPKNSVYLLLSAEDLVTALEEGNLNGELKKVAKRLKQDDNPVLMLIRWNC